MRGAARVELQLAEGLLRDGRDALGPAPGDGPDPARERLVRARRRVLRFRRAPPGPVLGAFARGWVGSRYRIEKPIGGCLRLVG